MQGAGGTEGGVTRFFSGLGMLILGLYLLLQSIKVTTGFGLGHSLVSFGGYGVTSGMVLIPFMIGVGMLFYNVKSIVARVLTSASLMALIGGVIASIRFRMVGLSAFDVITMLVLIAGGTGILLSSLRDLPKTVSD